MIPNIVIPVFPECKTNIQSMELLSIHMKNVHGETDHNRISRLTQTFTSESKRESEKGENFVQHKIPDCSECGIVFGTSDEMKTHNVKHHTSKLPS